jgi:hypothetical protein
LRTAAWDKDVNEAADVRLEPTEMSPKRSSLLLLEDIPTTTNWGSLVISEPQGLLCSFGAFLRIYRI